MPSDREGLINGSEEIGFVRGISNSSSVAYTRESILVEGNKPAWKAARWILSTVFTLGIGAMIAATGIILYNLPSCPSKPVHRWWQETSFYLVYPYSFRDEDGDGVGDFKGIAEKASYLSKLGVNGVLLSSIFDSPLRDFGFDIRNHSKPHASLGTEEDFVTTSRTLKSWGLKVILDFIPNHTSDEHPWFKKSVNRTPGFEDMYVWADGVKNDSGVLLPPNNWISVRGGSAWSWSEERGQFYLHQFSSFEPDLNLRNSDVLTKLDDSLSYWASIGVAGFRLRGADFLLEADDLSDEELVPGGAYDVKNYTCLVHSKTRNLASNGALFSRWKNIVGDGFFGVETLDNGDSTAVDFYANLTHHAAIDAVFAFDLIDATMSELSFSDFARRLTRWTDVGVDVVWLSGSGGESRLSSRLLTDRLVDGVQMMNFLLPGTPVLYYGDEVGMGNVVGISERFPEGSPARSPMQWSNDTNMGFSAATPWLQGLIGSNATVANADLESRPVWSRLQLMRKLAWMRVWMTGLTTGATFFPIVKDDFISIARVARGTAGCILGFNASPHVVEGVNLCPKKFRIGCRARIMARSVADCDNASFQPYHVDLSNMTFKPYEAIVGEFTPLFRRLKGLHHG